jgi:hypothetical protein
MKEQPRNYCPVIPFRTSSRQAVDEKCWFITQPLELGLDDKCEVLITLPDGTAIAGSWCSPLAERTEQTLVPGIRWSSQELELSWHILASCMCPMSGWPSWLP